MLITVESSLVTEHLCTWSWGFYAYLKTRQQQVKKNVSMDLFARKNAKEHCN